LIAIILVFINDFAIGLQLDRYAADFYLSSSPGERLHDLAGIYSSRGILSNADSSFLATELFYGLSREEQLSLFNETLISLDPRMRDDLIGVVDHLYVTLADVDPENNNTQLLRVMADSLQHTPDNRTGLLMREELLHWITGRKHAQNGEYEAALESYNTAVSLNSMNPATLYERAKIYILLRQYDNALADLDMALGAAKRSAPDVAPTPTSTVSPASIPPATSQTFNNIIVSTALPIPSPTPICACQPIKLGSPGTRYESNFTTLINIVSVIRTLIESDTRLRAQLRVSTTNYPNLQSQGLVR